MDLAITNVLRQIGLNTEVWKSSDGTSVVVLPHGGRILELYAPESNRNFLWTNPALQLVHDARGLYQSKGWCNSGGDRTWLSPEVDFFLPNFPDIDTYWQPREFDPGKYKLEMDGATITLLNRCSYKLSRSQQRVNVEISKRLSPALDPLRHLGASRNVRYAGYTLKTRLVFVEPQPVPTPVSLWSLLQLPFGGKFLIPTLSEAPVTTYLGSINKNMLSVTSHLITYKTQDAGLNKLGIPAYLAIGRVGYMYSDAGETCLVIRNFPINPSGEYIDVPWKETDRAGSVIEACNVNLSLGVFSELEYHTPAASGFGSDRVVQDESQVWAYRGAKSIIDEIAQILISPECQDSAPPFPHS